MLHPARKGRSQATIAPPAGRVRSDRLFYTSIGIAIAALIASLY